MRCNSCEREYDPDNMRWHGDDPYCEDCFNESFTYCSRCDETIDRDYARYNISDDVMCSDCYDEDEDPDAPDDPQIFDSQRNEIVSLARNWLSGKRPKRLIKITYKDYLLPEIREGVGLVDHALYLYGLQDREEYQLKVSPNLFNRVSQFTSLNDWNITIEQDVGTNRISISHSLREEKYHEVLVLLKELTTNPKSQNQAA